MFRKMIRKNELYRTFLTTADGKEFLSFLAKDCFFSRSTFSSDPLQMAKNEGKREAFLEILRLSEQDPELVRQASRNTYSDSQINDILNEGNI